jgi:hypothetical protein
LWLLHGEHNWVRSCRVVGGVVPFALVIFLLMCLIVMYVWCMSVLRWAAGDEFHPAAAQALTFAYSGNFQIQIDET